MLLRRHEHQAPGAEGPDPADQVLSDFFKILLDIAPELLSPRQISVCFGAMANDLRRNRQNGQPIDLATLAVAPFASQLGRIVTVAGLAALEPFQRESRKDGLEEYDPLPWDERVFIEGRIGVNGIELQTSKMRTLYHGDHQVHETENGFDKSDDSRVMEGAERLRDLGIDEFLQLMEMGVGDNQLRAFGPRAMAQRYLNFMYDQMQGSDNDKVLYTQFMDTVRNNPALHTGLLGPEQNAFHMTGKRDIEFTRFLLLCSIAFYDGGLTHYKKLRILTSMVQILQGQQPGYMLRLGNRKKPFTSQYV